MADNATVTDPAKRKFWRSALAWALVYLACIVSIVQWNRALKLPTTTTAPFPDSSQPRRRDWSKFQYQAPMDRTRSNDSVPVASNVDCGTAPTFESFWKLDGKHRSRLNEDKIVYEMFFQHNDPKDWNNFRYLELGAFDGIEESNTRFFDVCLGWDGLLIEPNPRVFPKLVDNRPNAHRMSYAASCSEEEEMANKTVAFWASVFTNAAQDESANREAYTSRPDLLREVPCGSLTPVLLDLFHGGHVNFFSLDTEGTEHFVLQQIDFSRITFDVIIAENINNFCQEKCESRDKARSILTAAGYILDSTTVPRSDLYTPFRNAMSR
jgi:Methyltransferase FkbM domain